MQNNKDKPYSLQDAKDEVGYGYTVLLKDKLESLHQAAELYASKATEELRKENEYLKTIIEDHRKLTISMNEEIERLKESNKHLE